VKTQPCHFPRCCEITLYCLSFLPHKQIIGDPQQIQTSRSSQATTCNKKHTRFWPEIATPFPPKKEEPLAAEWRKVASEYMTTVMHLFLAYPQTHHRNPNGIY
jgi:hypothetical protein